MTVQEGCLKIDFNRAGSMTRVSTREKCKRAMNNQGLLSVLLYAVNVALYIVLFVMLHIVLYVLCGGVRNEE